MYADHEIGVNEHLTWISDLRKKEDKVVYIIYSVDEKPIGILSVNNIDHKNKKADWAYYLLEKARGVEL